MRCRTCGSEVERKSASQKDCPDCRRSRVKESNRQRAANDRVRTPDWKERELEYRYDLQQPDWDNHGRTFVNNLLAGLLTQAIEVGHQDWIDDVGPGTVRFLGWPENVFERGDLHGEETDEPTRPHYKAVRGGVVETWGTFPDIPRTRKVDA